MCAVFARTTGGVLAIAQQCRNCFPFPGRIRCTQIMVEVPYVKVDLLAKPCGSG